MRDSTTHMVQIAGKIFKLKDPMISQALTTIAQGFVSFSSSEGRANVRVLKMRNPADLLDITRAYDNDSADILDARQFKTPLDWDRFYHSLLEDRKNAEKDSLMDFKTKVTEAVKKSIKSHLFASESVFAEVISKEPNQMIVEGIIDLDNLAAQILSPEKVGLDIYTPSSIPESDAYNAQAVRAENLEWAVGVFYSSADPQREVLMLVLPGDLERCADHPSFIRWEYARYKS